jgi:hypothetical protein
MPDLPSDLQSLVSFDALERPQIRLVSPEAVRDVTHRLSLLGVSFRMKLQRKRSNPPAYLVLLLT